MRPKALTADPAKYEELFDYSLYPLKTSPVNHRKYREAYGRMFPAQFTDLEIELWCGSRKIGAEEGGLGEFAHYRLMMQHGYPFLRDEWTPWLDQQLGLFCGESGTHTMLAGSNIGKSWFLGTFPRLWQAGLPYTRGVMIINTTQKSQTQRAWKYVLDCCNAFPWLPGHISASKLDPAVTIYKEITNPRNPQEIYKALVPGVGIISQTVKQGKVAKATADLKGMHPKDGLIVIIEEGNHVEKQPIERARSNWIGNSWYSIVIVGNPEIEDQMDGDKVAGGSDSLYEFSTPLHGWSSIVWGETKQWDNKFGGRSLHFDPYDSPRIKHPEKYTLSTWLPSTEYLDKKAEELGGEGTALFKQQVLGIYDHESLPFNPINQGMIHRFNCDGRAAFTGMDRQRWAGFDPAYSGRDEAFLKIAESGMTDQMKEEIDFLDERTNFSFTIDKSSGEEPSFQMLNWVREKLSEWHVPYENFIMDANVIGIGLGDIFSAYLSKSINKVVVQGKPTERPLDMAGDRTARDICLDKATELWIAFQQLIITGQIKGLDKTIVKQLTDMPAENRNGKIKVLEKYKFRNKFGYSPDRAECCLFIVDLIRERGLARSMPKESPGMLVPSAVQSMRVLRVEDVFVNMAPRSYMEGGGVVTSNPFLNAVNASSNGDKGFNMIHNLFRELGWDKK